MWILPKQTGTHPWPLWSTIKETDWFLLTRNNAGLLVEKPYRIILKVGKNKGYLVAVGKEDEIDQAWTYIQQNIAQSLGGDISKDELILFALGKFQSLAVDENLHTLPPEAKTAPVLPQKVFIDVNMDLDEHDQHFYWESGDLTSVEADLNDMAIEDPSLVRNALQHFNLATSTTVTPKQLNIPQGEIVIGMFQVSLWSSGIPRAGKFYVFQNYLGFVAPSMLVFSEVLWSIPFSNIVHVQSINQRGFEVLQITSKNDKTSFKSVGFATISGGHAIYSLVNELWAHSLKISQNRASDAKRVRQGEKKETHLVSFEEASLLKERLIGSGNTFSGITSNSRSSSVSTLVQNSLTRFTPKFIRYFKLPQNEILLSLSHTSVTVYARRSSSLIKSSSDLVNVEGILYLTTHFLIFQDIISFNKSPHGSQLSSSSQMSSFFKKDQSKLDNEEDFSSIQEDTGALMEAEWDVAAAEMDSSMGSTSSNTPSSLNPKKRIKNVPGSSLAARPESRMSVWMIIPLREVSKIRLTKPQNSSGSSVAYQEFGVSSEVIQIHLPYNMYAFTLVNRKNFFSCLCKVYDRVKRQENSRYPLPNFSLDRVYTQSSSSSQYSQSHISTNSATTSSPPVSIKNSESEDVSGFSYIPSSPPSSSPTHVQPNTSGNVLEAPPRQVYFDHINHHPLNTTELKFSLAFYDDPHQFFPTHRARDRLQEEKFLSYFHKYGQSVGLVRKGPELPILVRDGIPHSLRGHMWFVLSGAATKMMVAPKNYYHDILVSHEGQVSVAIDQIERDLHRSMPNHPFYSISHPKGFQKYVSSLNPNEDNLEQPEPVGISRLRRVLRAYSWHNPVIGYCQSMNIVTAAILLYMSEEEAFFTLITLVDYLEEYWTRDMLGAIVDMNVLKDLLKTRKPNLVACMEKFELDYSIVALPWFMCLYIGYAPMQTTLRLLDCFFYYSGLGKATSILFQSAITIFATKDAELMVADDSIAVTKILKDALHEFDCDELINLIFLESSYSCSSTLIEELRNFHKYTAIKDVELQNQQDDFKKLIYGPSNIVMPGSQTSTSIQTKNENTSHFNGPISPPNTPVHFPLKDLKRIYLTFRDAISMQDTIKKITFDPIKAQYLLQQGSTPNTSLLQTFTNRNSDSNVDDKTRRANSGSIISSLNLEGFLFMLETTFSWWPRSMESWSIVRIFNWMDQKDLKRVSFVEFIQGIDMFCYSSKSTLIKLFFDLFCNQDQNSLVINFEGFTAAIHCIYSCNYHSKFESIQNTNSEPSPKLQKRQKINLEDDGDLEDDLDDWLYLSADEQFYEKYPLSTQQDIFKRNSKNGFMLEKVFLEIVSKLW